MSKYSGDSYWSRYSRIVLRYLASLHAVLHVILTRCMFVFASSAQTSPDLR